MCVTPPISNFSISNFLLRATPRRRVEVGVERREAARTEVSKIKRTKNTMRYVDYRSLKESIESKGKLSGGIVVLGDEAAVRTAPRAVSSPLQSGSSP